MPTTTLNPFAFSALAFMLMGKLGGLGINALKRLHGLL
jgi:hypothetical protein